MARLPHTQDFYGTAGFTRELPRVPLELLQLHRPVETHGNYHITGTPFPCSAGVWGEETVWRRFCAEVDPTGAIVYVSGVHRDWGADQVYAEICRLCHFSEQDLREAAPLV